MEYFLKHQQTILRTVGVLFLLLGFIIHFWVVPQKGLSQNERAAANLARMEASVTGSSSKTLKKKSDTSKFLKKLKDTQEKQMEYITIFVMLLGAGSLGYSFIKKRDEEEV